jgi:hypothetical protein
MYPVPDLLLRIWFGSLVSDLSFLHSISMMVSSGLAGAHVQPVLEINLSCELRAVSYEQTETLVCLKLAAHSSKQMYLSFGMR